MARNNSRRRDTSAISNHRLPVSTQSFRPSTTPSRLSPLRQFEDLRTWHPSRNRHPRDFSGPVTRFRTVNRLYRLQENPVRVLSSLAESILPSNPLSYIGRWKDATDTAFAFANPRKTLTCVRRQIRKEVLHALHLVRSGGSGGRSNWNDNSNIRCK